MVGAKRDFPFEHAERGPAKVQKEDILSIYKVTLNKLKHGALSLRPGLGLGEEQEVKNSKFNEIANCKGERRAGNAEAIESVETMTRCYICTSKSTSITCFHCTRRCCGSCRKQCDGCQGLFCSVCCTSNYDERNDRSFCFECKNGGEASSAQAPVYSDCEIKSRAPSTKYRQSTLDFLVRASQTTEGDQPCSMDVI